MQSSGITNVAYTDYVYSGTNLICIYACIVNVEKYFYHLEPRGCTAAPNSSRQCADNKVTCIQNEFGSLPIISFIILLFFCSKDLQNCYLY